MEVTSDRRGASSSGGRRRRTPERRHRAPAADETSSSSFTYDPRRYDELRLRAARGEVGVSAAALSPDVVRVEAAAAAASDGGGGGVGGGGGGGGGEGVLGRVETYRLRHLAAFLPFTFPQWNIFVPWDNEVLASHVALRHVNENVTDVSPEIGRLHAPDSPCKDTRFTIEFFDTASSVYNVSRDLSGDVFPRRWRSPIDIVGGDDNVTSPQPHPTAVIGPVQSRVANPMAVLTGVNSLVQVSPISTSTLFDSKDEFPLFGRTVPPVGANAAAAASFLSSLHGASHVGVLYVRDEWGEQYFRSFQEACGRLDPPVEVVAAAYEPLGRLSPEEVLRPLVESEYRYFLGIMYAVQITALLPVARRLGIAGPGNVWLLSESAAVYVHDLHTTELGEALTGSAILIGTARDLVAKGDERYEAFVDEWMTAREDEDVLDWIMSKRPRHAKGEDRPPALTGDEASIGPYPGLMFDAIVALALATCDAETRAVEGGGRGRGRRRAEDVTAEELFDSFRSAEFMGASGPVRFDRRTGSRDPATFPFSVRNLVFVPPPEGSNATDGSFVWPVTGLYSPTPDGRGMEWTSVGEEPYVYSDGTTVPPLDLPRLEEEMNLVPTGALAACLTLCGMALLLSMGFAAWTYRHRRTAVVRKAQPFFLWMLCSGTLVMGSAIVPMSLQEPVNQEGLDAACMATPWLFGIGFVVAFSALLCKTNRLNDIFNSGNYRRVKVRPRDVLVPFVLLLVMTVTILTAWTVVAPWKYTRKYSKSVDRFRRPNESNALCSPEPSENGGGEDVVFIVLLGLVFVVALLYAVFAAYRARSISTEYSESHYIAVSMAVILEAFVIGGPILFVVRENPTARFVVGSILIAILCAAVLLPMFVPKLGFLRRWRTEEASRESRRLERRRRLQESRTREAEAKESSMKNVLGRGAVNVLGQDAVLDLTDATHPESWHTETTLGLAESSDAEGLRVAQVSKRHIRLESACLAPSMRDLFLDIVHPGRGRGGIGETHRRPALHGLTSAGTRRRSSGSI